MRFTGKHGIVHEVSITDSNLRRIINRCDELPGRMLFQHVNADGVPQPVTSSDVNQYIKEASGGDFTAKHFRTWGASVLAFEALVTAPHDIGLKTMLEPVTEALGNTPAIARKSYVHPALIALVKQGQADLRASQLPRATQYLSRAERGLIALLESGTSPFSAEAA
jgi:DNA topoisomerase-1